MTLVDTPEGRFNGRLRVSGRVLSCGVNLIHPMVAAPHVARDGIHCVAPDVIRGSHRADAAWAEKRELARIKSGPTGAEGSASKALSSLALILSLPRRSC